MQQQNSSTNLSPIKQRWSYESGWPIGLFLLPYVIELICFGAGYVRVKTQKYLFLANQVSGTQRHHSRVILQTLDTEPSKSVVFINPSPVSEHEWQIQAIGRWWLNSSHLFFSAGSKQFSGYSTVVLLYSNIILKKNPCDLFGEVWNLQVSKLLVLNMVLFLLFFTRSKTVYYHQGCSWKKAGGNVLQHIYLKTFTAVITVGAMAINK